MSSTDECRECKAAAEAVAKWKAPVLAKRFVGELWKIAIVLAVSGLMLLAVHGVAGFGGVWKDQVGLWLCIVSVGGLFGGVIMLIVSIAKLLVFNVLIARNRGIYLFPEDKGRRLHRHLALPVATPFAATPVIIGIGVGWLFRRTKCYGAAWQNWEVVGEPMCHELVVKDRSGCQLPRHFGDDDDTATVLEEVASHSSVAELLWRLDRRGDNLRDALNKLGVGVHATILAASAGRGQTPSPAAKALRERLERLLESFRVPGYREINGEETLRRWEAKAEQLLKEDAQAAAVEARIAAQAREVQPAPTTVAGQPPAPGDIR